MTIANSVIVWDQELEPPLVPEEVLCWQSYRHGDSIRSVPRHLETHAERIRSKYLAFVRDLGESLVGGKRVVDHLDPGDGFSFWWMTTIAEKAPLKSPRIYDCLRLFALEEMLAASQPSTLRLVSADESLADAIRAMCRNSNITFTWQPSGGGKRKWSLRAIYEALPNPLKALLSLRHVILRWPLRGLQRPNWFLGKNAIFICSYFTHLDPALCGQGQFRSRQWEDLPKELHDSGRRTNWIQLFLFSKAVPSVRIGLAWVRRFNEDATNQGMHTFLDSFLSIAIVLQAFKSWGWLHTVRWRLRDIATAFVPRSSTLWLWPILRDDWYSSLSGHVGMANCLSVAQFDAVLADIPYQETGLYLCENQAWEKALLRAWRRHGHGRIIGVQHATAPFWHLYYFHDPRCLATDDKCALPLPDRLAVNGAAALRAFTQAGYPKERLAEVEALRYLKLPQVTALKPGNAARGGGARGDRPRVRVLVLGDMVGASMSYLLHLLEAASAQLQGGFEFTLKPHPAFAVDLAPYPGLQAVETQEALEQILSHHDVAVAANSTSAAVDAFVGGLRVIIALDGDALNLSPLRGQRGVCFVTTSGELAQSLRTVGRDASVEERANFFFLDPALPRWRRLLRAAADDSADSYGGDCDAAVSELTERLS